MREEGREWWPALEKKIGRPHHSMANPAKQTKSFVICIHP